MVRTSRNGPMTGVPGARGARAITPGSSASTASGSASVTVAIRFTQRICVGSTGRRGSAVLEREEQHREQHDQRLAEVGRQHEGDRLLDVVEDVPALLDGGLDAREVVVGEHDVGGLTRGGGAGLAHRDADVGLLERRRVVDPVAGHRDHVSARLQRPHEAQLVLGRDAREDGCPRRPRGRAPHRRARRAAAVERAAAQARTARRSPAPSTRGRP